MVERYEALKIVSEYRNAYEALKEKSNIEGFSNELAVIEDRLWDWGSRYIAARGRLLPDRLTSDVRRALGEFRATIERLASDQVGGRVYAKLMGELEHLFKKISDILPVWCVTNLSASGTVPFESGLFDLVVIDEASQCDIPSALPLLYRAKRVMIIGDPNQLRHISTIEKFRDQQLQNKHELTSVKDQPYTFSNNSLYDLAATCAGSASVISLREHFRSHRDIVEFSNRHWYQGTLRVCTDYRRLNWVSEETPGIRWTQTNGKVKRPSGGGALNTEEAKAVVKELGSLLVDRQFKGSVGIVTPFRAQANRIRDLVNDKVDLDIIEHAELIVDTAHGFQGDERDVIIFSPCVAKEMPRGAKYFLSSTGNLFNVAITRARSLLHVIGDLSACSTCGVSHVEAFAKYVTQIKKEIPLTEKQDYQYQEDPNVGYWEKPFYESLLRTGLKPMPQYHVNQYVLDFAIKKKDLLLDIEIDGEHYHKELDGTRCRRDVIRDLRLTALGWQVKRFWVYQIRDEMDDCVREILTIIGGEGKG